MSVLAFSHRKRGARRFGLGMLDTMLALGLATIASASVFQMTQDSQQLIISVALADKMNMLRTAAQAYLQANYGVLQSYISAGSTVTIPLTGSDTLYGAGSLSAGRFLPSDFDPMGPNQQGFAFLVRSVAENGTEVAHLEGMIISYGGTNLSDRQVGMAVQKMGSYGGGILSTAINKNDGTELNGAYGLWSYPVSDWKTTTGYMPAAGHVAAIVMTSGRPVSDYLNRYYVGLDDANTMHTSINMDGSSLMTAKVIDGVGTNDIYVGTSSNPSSVYMQNGGYACLSDGTGCHLDIGTAGGFYDNNDGWITINSDGLRVSGTGNNMMVEGISTFDSSLSGSGAITLMNAGPIWTDGNSAQLPLKAYQFDTSNYWLVVGDETNLQNILAPMFNAGRFISASDVDNTGYTYYFQPDSASYIRYMTAQSLYVQNAMTVAGSTGWGGWSNISVGTSGTTTVGDQIRLSGSAYTNGVTGSTNGVKTVRGVVDDTAYIGDTDSRAVLNSDGSAVYNANQYAARANVASGNLNVEEGDVVVNGTVNALYSTGGSTYRVWANDLDTANLDTVDDYVQYWSAPNYSQGVTSGGTASSEDLWTETPYVMTTSSLTASGNIKATGNMHMAQLSVNGPVRIDGQQHFLFETMASGHSTANGADCTNQGGTGTLVTSGDRSTVAYCDATNTSRWWKLE